MDPPPRTPLFSLFLLLFLPLLPKPASSKISLSFDFSSFSLQNLTLLGDSHLRNGAIVLTGETTTATTGSGTAIFNHPIPFRDPVTNASPSFSTKFSFAITNSNPNSYGGDGLTFFISPNARTLGNTGAHLGLFNPSQPIRKGPTIIAVEFDTWLDRDFGDPSPNHIGLDISNPRSLKAVDLGPQGIELKSGNLITAWIKYNQNKKRLKVWLCYINIRPDSPVLSARFDLSNHFDEFMYVGFSASIGNGNTKVVHLIKNWRFRTEIPAIPNSPSSNNFHKMLGLSLGILGSSAVGAAILVFVGVSLKKRTETRADQDNSFKPEIKKGQTQFRIKELQSATKNFHNSRILGKGASGTVYLAIHQGNRYAVKRWSKKPDQNSNNEFITELTTIIELDNKNLVKLEGWCTEENELMLVYEYMSNGSLDKFIHPRAEPDSTPTLLDWRQRYNIATELASVLAYMHQECQPPVIHRDIKSSNVMLDKEFNPRLGDFGFATLKKHDEDSFLRSNEFQPATRGYAAPELIFGRKASVRSDVYSYGVVVLEICCGRSAVQTNPPVDFVKWVWDFYSKNRLIEVVDRRLLDRRLCGKFDRGEMERLLLVGMSCANRNMRGRPTMTRVVQILKHEVEPVAVPKVMPPFELDWESD